MLTLDNIMCEYKPHTVIINGKLFDTDHYEDGYGEMYEDIMDRYGENSAVVSFDTKSLRLKLEISPIESDCDTNRRTYHTVWVDWSRVISFYGDADDNTDYEEKVRMMIKNGEITPTNDDYSGVSLDDHIVW